MMLVALFSLALAPATVRADSANYRVSLAFDAAVPSEATLTVTTKATNSSMCLLVPTRVTTQPVTSLIDAQGSWVDRPGVVDVEMSILPQSMCYMAFGPHSGPVTLPLSLSARPRKTAPFLSPGSYTLVVNGEEQGTLVVEPSGISLK